jgi:hypothetical protein
MLTIRRRPQGMGWGKEPAVGVSRRAADLAAYPKLVVIYLGMREW